MESEKKKTIIKLKTFLDKNKKKTGKLIKAGNLHLSVKRGRNRQNTNNEDVEEDPQQIFIEEKLQ